jgi:hypothetical protein
MAAAYIMNIHISITCRLVGWALSNILLTLACLADGTVHEKNAISDTNYITRASADCQQFSGPIIKLWYHLPPDTNVVFTNLNYYIAHTNIKISMNWAERLYKRWPYCLPTNSLCGPMVLRDGSNKLVAMLRPEINLPTTYPERFSLAEMTRILAPTRAPVNGHDSPIRAFGMPFAEDENDFFGMVYNLNLIFDVKTNGSYELTIWPKIYRGCSTNLDLYERIDMPEIKMSINWDTNWSNSPYFRN